MAAPGINVRDDVATLYRDGIVGNKGAFSREWVEQLREDMMTAFWKRSAGRAERSGEGLGDGISRYIRRRSAGSSTWSHIPG